MKPFTLKQEKLSFDRGLIIIKANIKLTEKEILKILQKFLAIIAVFWWSLRKLPLIFNCFWTHGHSKERDACSEHWLKTSYSSGLNEQEGSFNIRNIWGSGNWFWKIMHILNRWKSYKLFTYLFIQFRMLVFACI